MTIYVLAPRDRMYVITPSWYLMIFGFVSFAFNNNNELYLDDHTSTYSVAKAIFRNQNDNTGQLRYFDNNLSRTSKLKLNGFLSLLSTSTTVLKQNN